MFGMKGGGGGIKQTFSNVATVGAGRHGRFDRLFAVKKYPWHPPGPRFKPGDRWSIGRDTYPLDHYTYYIIFVKSKCI